MTVLQLQMSIDNISNIKCYMTLGKVVTTEYCVGPKWTCKRNKVKEMDF